MTAYMQGQNAVYMYFGAEIQAILQTTTLCVVELQLRHT